MKLFIKVCLTLLGCVSVNAFATQYCPPTLTVNEGKYEAPSGWHITLIDIKKSLTFNLPFFQAEYNYSWKIGKTTDNRVSCVYYKNEYAFIEITTDKNNFPMPKTRGSHSWVYWKSNKSKVCGTIYAVEIADCPWDEG